MTGGAQTIEVEGRVIVVVVDGDVELTVAIEIGDGDAAAVTDLIAAGSAGDVDELAGAAVVGEEAITLVAVPRVVSDEVVAEEEACFVLFDVCDRTVSER